MLTTCSLTSTVTCVLLWKLHALKGVYCYCHEAMEMMCLQVNRVCMWHYSSEVSRDESPSPSSLVEPVFLCEQEMAADTTDLHFLDEERLFGSFSNGCVMLFRFRAAMQVDFFVFLSQVMTSNKLLFLPPLPSSLSLRC